MAAFVTRKGSACSTREGADGRPEFVEVFEVTGLTETTDAARRDEAIAACAPRNDPHPQNPLALRREASATGKLTVTVTLVYAIPDAGAWEPPPPTNPWEKPWRVDISSITERAEFDVTADYKPVQNTNGDTFDSGIEQDIDGLLIVFDGYYRDVDTFLRKLVKYRKRVNSEDFTFSPGGSTGAAYLIAAEELKCVSVEADPYDFGSVAPIKGRMRLEWRPAPWDRTDPANADRKWYPHQLRRRNMGRRAWWLDGSTERIGNIVDDKGVAVSKDVDLLESGAIAEADSYFVTADKHTSIAAPGTVLPGHFDSETSGTFGDGVTWLFFRKCEAVSFDTLLGTDEFLPPPPPP